MNEKSKIVFQIDKSYSKEWIDFLNANKPFIDKHLDITIDNKSGDLIVIKFNQFSRDSKKNTYLFMEELNKWDLLMSSEKNNMPVIIYHEGWDNPPVEMRDAVYWDNSTKFNQ